MKHTFILLSFLGIGLSAMAQGNLQFNQVKLVTSQQAVPANKVWKVESVIYNIPADQTAASSSASQSCGASTYYSKSVEINGVPTKTGNGTHSAAYSNLAYIHAYTELPLWLPAGATLSGGPCLNQVSVIEFNIVP
jgi:hypothetical protein